MVTPMSCSSVSETSTESGTISPIASAARQSRRKSRITSSDSTPPSTISCPRFESASFTKRACAATTWSVMSGNSPLSSATAASRHR